MRHLDTNVVIAYLNGNRTVTDHLNTYLPNVAISSLVLAELRFGARASQKVTDNLARLEELTTIIEVVDFDSTSADVYSQIRLELRQKGRPTGEMDLLIASVAIASQAILVTNNTKHFANITGLKLEDWLTTEPPS